MPEAIPDFRNLRTVIPENESESSGPCLREALSQAGIETELPDWPDLQQLPEICEKLELDLFQGKGKRFSLSRKGEYVLGHVVDHSESPRVGHFTYTDDIETTLRQQVKKSDLFAIIKIPKQSK